MTWRDEFLPLAEWAFRMQDLRHAYTQAQSATQVMRSPGIEWALEATLVLAIYEAALGKGYKPKRTIHYEKPYPGTRNGKNPPRADLAMKDSGPGQNWAFIEVKSWNLNNVKKDVEKLRGITTRAQRWIFVYRVRGTSGHKQSLKRLIERGFEREFDSITYKKFGTVTSKDGGRAVCELAFARLR